jgi:DNA-binding transcriptional ArsR family regulator
LEPSDAGGAVEPEDQMVVADLETVRVVSDEFRMQLLQRLRARELTVKELASEVGTTPKKLYYHVNLLEQHGLIRVVGTRLVSGIVERRYRATAYLLIFDDTLFGMEAGADMMLANMFANARSDITEGLRSGRIVPDHEAPMGRRLVFKWGLSNLTLEEAERFSIRLADLIDEFPGLGRGEVAGESETYRLLMMMFPSSGVYEAPDGAQAEEELA